MLEILAFFLSFVLLQEPAPIPPQAPTPAASPELCVTHVESLHYPPLARQTLIKGEVKLSAMVDETGKVILPALSSGHPLLAEVALANIRKWTFRPPKGGAITIEVTYEFVLRGQPEASPNEEFFFDLPNHVLIVANPPEVQTMYSK